METPPIVFLRLNKELRAIFKNKVEADPSILIPAEFGLINSGSVNPGSAVPAGKDYEPEMILSAMLRVISAGVLSPAPETPFTGIKEGDIFNDAKDAVVPANWIDYYRRFVLAAKPEIFHEFTSASIVKTGNGDYDMALEINAALEGLFPGSPGVLLNKAQILELKAAELEKKGHSAEKENAETLSAYETALSMEPVLPDTLFNAGFFFMRMRSYARARSCFSKYIDSDEDSEKKKQAQKIVQEISSQGLDDDNYRQAYDFVSRGKNEDGLVKIKEFIEKHSKVWNGWFILGWALRKLGRFTDALESFRKAMELGGDNIEIRNETAICLMELKDHKGARRELELALREEPENIKIISNLGVLAMKSGNRIEAEAYFRTVLELDNEDPLALHFLKDTQ